MPVEYKNRRGKTYYLHEGRTKTGKPKYHFSLKNNGELVAEIPYGYEIYEHPGTGGVFLRKKLPQLITNIEKDAIEKELKKKEGSRRYLFDIKGKIITIWESNQDIEVLRDLFRDVQPTSLNGRSDNVSAIEDMINIAATYGPVMKFTIEDEKKRTFIAERYCFLGSIDDWIHIGEPDSLKNLVKKYLKHLDEDSFFDLF
ncbi:MAG: hypothetical protein JRJ86_00025 [Deltaproteobacteria bacterium]|nr:hypothetical protein [Deltaproteobacteria bacterium]MBW2342884.1 hypothetical protein [Deltaproteobacteria bacterium]